MKWRLLKKINVVELLLSRISQVYNCKLILQTHKHYNYLQGMLEQKLFAKVINNLEQKGLVWELLDFTLKVVEHKS